MRDLILNFSAWMIEDGSHKPVEVGQTRKFAIEVFPKNKNLLPLPARCLSLVHNDENIYTGSAKVWKDVERKLTIFDFGSILAIKKNWRHGHGFFSTEWGFHVDPYFAKSVEEVNYEWIVKKILLDASPLIVEEEDEIVKDTSRPNYIEVQTTDLKAELPVINNPHDVVYFPSYLRWLLYLTRKE